MASSAQRPGKPDRHQDRTSQGEQGEGLEDLNVTRPAPVDRPPDEGAKEKESDGLENGNVTRPDPPQ